MNRQDAIQMGTLKVLSHAARRVLRRLVGVRDAWVARKKLHELGILSLLVACLLTFASPPSVLAEGSIVGWGLFVFVEPPRIENLVAIAAGQSHSLGLKSDSSIVAWGLNEHGQCNVPEPNSGFVAIAGGGYHSLGLRADSSIVAWGSNGSGQCDVPEPNSGFVAIAPGYDHNLGLTGDVTPTVPAAPSNLVATCVGVDSVLVTWEDNSAEEVWFEVWRKMGVAGTWEHAKVLYANTESWLDTSFATSGEYYYRVRACNFAGCSDWSNEDSASTYPAGVVTDGGIKTHVVSVSPNPFRGSLKVCYGLEKRMAHTIRVYSISGQLVKTIADGVGGTGINTAIWDGTSSSGARVAPGIYFLRMEAGSYCETRRVVLLR